MEPELVNGAVHANCPGCNGARSTFEYREQGREFGFVDTECRQPVNGRSYRQITFRLMRCGGCGRGGVATVCYDGTWLTDGALKEFYPFSEEHAPLPEAVPHGIRQEFREAERCASFGAWRAASALLRSVLEKTLKANGFENGALAGKIDRAAACGVLTATRKKRAHEEIRVLGNEVVHDEWKEIHPDDYRLAHDYAQRILEDFYDDPATVQHVLIEAREREKPAR